MKANLPTYIQADERAAIVPIKYIEAIKALRECQTIESAELWANKADALAAWAKIYKQDEAGKEARRLKLYAYRKMGELAEQLRPTTALKHKGAHSLLREYGLDQHKARAILQISRATDLEFSRVVHDARGVAASAIQFRGRGRRGGQSPSSDSYGWLSSHDTGLHLPSILGKLRRRDPRDIALNMRRDEGDQARAMAMEVIDWFDELERCIPKGDP